MHFLTASYAGEAIERYPHGLALRARGARLGSRLARQNADAQSQSAKLAGSKAGSSGLCADLCAGAACARRGWGAGDADGAAAAKLADSVSLLLIQELLAPVFIGLQH